MVPLAIIGVVRVCVVLVAADRYDLSLFRARPMPYAPTVWVVIPAQGYTVFNREYVIGGVGSVFRTSIVRACGNYDWRIIFVADAIAHTQAVPSLRGLLRQRFRWKFGRLQAFCKHRSLFFGKSCSRLLSWLHLPYTAAGEVLVLFEPLFIYVVVSATFQTGWFTGILLLCAVYTGVALFTVLGDVTEPWSSKLRLLALAPLAYRC